jgi:hypothetical protein
VASFTREQLRDGTEVWDVCIRRRGYPTIGRRFKTLLAGQIWAERTEASLKGEVLPHRMTFDQLCVEGLPRLTNPATAAFAYWRNHLGNLRLDRITPTMVAMHRDQLLGAECRGHGHKSTKARSEATVRNYLIELSRLFAVAVKELRVLETNPCAHVTKPRASKQIVRWLTDDERTRLLDACKASQSPDL